ncbi:hypothetical protein MBM_02767 [Drepanopeziza brunnea f. sp. 'multigermtubi' MB_m1]|uniref:Uncharacterized protein n=1 Tax=Marssonina brunnea f. sp. multigermtubi (strain MB_m1) TaxID=1072389 RepID=K1WPG2_MARBU|nr:uncharacterized protein MBM_02767 [Drepanopeziza brunnea f. sp. 'multigermtubi' MB_m1]EKD19530.1 hypothetical protein MBM_02767 [Drepanopeziza brunnea f. sp. 'multigermtubi' MB_m1]
MASTRGRDAMVCLNHGQRHCSAQFLSVERNRKSRSSIEMTTASPSYTDGKSVKPSSSCSGKPAAESSNTTPFCSIDPSTPRILGLPLDLAKWSTCGLVSCIESWRREKKVVKVLRRQPSYLDMRAAEAPPRRWEPPPHSYYILREASPESVLGYEISVESGAVTVAAAVAAETTAGAR